MVLHWNNIILDFKCPSAAPYALIQEGATQITCNTDCNAGYLDNRDSTSLKCYVKGSGNGTYCNATGIYLASTSDTACSVCDSSCRTCLGAGPKQCTSCNWNAPYLMLDSKTAASSKPIGYCTQSCTPDAGYADESEVANPKCFTDFRCKTGLYFYGDIATCYCNLLKLTFNLAQCPTGLVQDNSSYTCYVASFATGQKLSVLAIILIVGLMILW